MRVKRMATGETVYRERANGRFEFWTYSDGQRVYLSQDLAERMERQGAILVRVE